MNWTEDEIAYLVLRKGKGNSWTQIQKDLNNKFARDRSISSIMGKWNYLNAKLLKAPFFSKSERDFIFNCSRNNLSDHKTIRAFYEQYERKIDKYDILCIVKDKTIEYEEARIRSESNLDLDLVNLKARIKKNLDNKIKQNKVKNMKRKNTSKWTKEEDISVCRYSSAKEAGEELSKTNTKRTQRAYSQRWYKLRKSGAMLALKEVKDKKARKPRSSGYSSSRWTKEEDLLLSKVSSLNELEVMAKKIGRSLAAVKVRYYSKGFSLEKKNNNRIRWTKEEDFELVCNFYELSIDEARNRFNRSYGAIATRLEMLVDSTKPAHISMLMEAAVLIKARKGLRDVEPTKTPKLSRKERKQAKKLAKLEKQMSKLRGE